MNKEVIKLKNKNLMLIIVGAVAFFVGGAAGFFGGMQYQKSQTSQNMMLNRNATMRRFGRNGNRMAVRGQVINSGKNTITVKMPDGSTKIVILSSSTMIGKTTTGSTSDITNGSNVIVFGTTNSDGSLTAQNIQIGNGLFGPRGSESPMPSSAPQGY